MEFEKIFASAGIVLLAIIAYSALINSWNTGYGQNVGQTFKPILDDVQTLENTSLFSLSTQAGNNTNTPSGAGTTSTNADLVSRALGILTSLPTLLGLIPALFSDFAMLLFIPAAYVSIATWIFLFSFAILFAYILIIGIRRLL